MWLESFRILLVIAIQLDLEIHQMDIVGAYLNGKLIEEIYMKQIPGYEDGSDKVLWLRKTLYGLKQAGRVWNRRLHKALTELNYTRLYTDTCIYVHHQNGKLAIIAFHVDDSAIFAGADHMDTVKSELKLKFNTRNLRELNHFVGIKITHDRVNRTISISQGQYIREILEWASMSESNTVSTPMAPKQDFTKFDGPWPDYPYTTMIGSLMWAALCTCPDIAFVVNNLVQFNSSYGPEHIARVKRIFHYLKGTIDYRIQYSHSNLGTKVIGYTDADWAEEKDRKSISGNVFIMSGGAVAWSAKKQGSIALSTLEAEYISLSHATCHVIWHQMLVQELGFEPDRPFNLNNDNRGAIALTHDP